MEILSDTSTIIAVILNEPEKEQIIKLTLGHEILSPKSVIFEVGNAFSAMLKRKRLEIGLILDSINEFNQIPIRYVNIDLQNSLRIANEQNIYAYDAYFIDCAIRLKKPLLALDKKLINVARCYKIDIIEV
jgi:predicted nucleic acid-binding protein